MAQLNPSGYSQATPSGRDPTTGAILRDRYHQMRGNEYRMTEGTGLASKIAQDFLASRGAPITPQNLVIAQAYLRGGALDALAMQQSTESEIADAAIAADSGGARAGGGQSSPLATGTPPAPPSAQPPVSDAPVPDTVMPTGDANALPFLLPGLLTGAAAGAGAAVAGRGPRLPATRTDALTGEIVGSPPAVRAEAGPVVPSGGGVDEAIEDAIIVGVNPADTSSAVTGPVLDRTALPSPPKQIGPPAQAPQAAAQQPNPYAAQVEALTPAPHVAVGNADDVDWGYKSSTPQGAIENIGERAENAPVPTEAVVPQTETPGPKVGNGAIAVGDKEVNYDIYKGGKGFIAVTDDGRQVTEKTRALLAKALRAAF